MDAWYLIYSKPQQERVALENLKRQGYLTYLPLLRSRKRVRGRYTSVVETMFPRYLFIHLSDQSDDWGPIRSTIGVSKLVRFGGLPARVPDELVDLLRGREDEEGLQTLPAQPLEPGDPVRIVDGLLAGYEANFEARSGSERVIVLLKTAEQVARVIVSEDSVEPVSPCRSSRQSH